jgi:hypothetical protein
VTSIDDYRGLCSNSCISGPASVSCPNRAGRMVKSCLGTFGSDLGVLGGLAAWRGLNGVGIQATTWRLCRRDALVQ